MNTKKKYKSKKNEHTKYKTEQHTNAAAYQLIREYRRECWFGHTVNRTEHTSICDDYLWMRSNEAFEVVSARFYLTSTINLRIIMNRISYDFGLLSHIFGMPATLYPS